LPSLKLDKIFISLSLVTLLVISGSLNLEVVVKNYSYETYSPVGSPVIEFKIGVVSTKNLEILPAFVFPSVNLSSPTISLDRLFCKTKAYLY
jgi:hypothetical protein